MSTGSNDNSNRPEWKRLLYSFKFAIEGLIHILKRERNMRIHFVVSILVLFLAYFFSISKVEFYVILLLIGFVTSLEAINTAIERTVDLVTMDKHPIAKQAKDASAAAVFIFSIISLIIGGMIFFKPVVEWFLSIN